MSRTSGCANDTLFSFSASRSAAGCINARVRRHADRQLHGALRALALQHFDGAIDRDGSAGDHDLSGELKLAA